MPTFILGAGFDADASAEAGPIFGDIGAYQIDCGYPLVGDTLRLCFGMDRAPAGLSTEDLFSDALERRDYNPIQKLADRLRQADHYIANRLAQQEHNCYRVFFEAVRWEPLHHLQL